MLYYDNAYYDNVILKILLKIQFQLWQVNINVFCHIDAKNLSLSYYYFLLKILSFILYIYSPFFIHLFIHYIISNYIIYLTKSVNL